MFDLKVLLIVAAVALAIGAGCGSYAAWGMRSTRADLDLLKLKDTFDNATAAAREQSRAAEHAMQEQINQVGKDAREQNKQIALNVAAAADSTDSLLQAADNRLSAAACDPGVARRGQAATSAAYLYSQLLGESQRLAEGLAAEADRARSAGASCEVAYDLVRGGLKGLAKGPELTGG